MRKRRCSICHRTGHNRLRHRGNPVEQSVPRGLSGAARWEFLRALRLSERIHGPGRGAVLDLTKAERHNPRYVALVGSADQIDYAPRPGSKLGRYIYQHKSGDKGLFAAGSKRRPRLAVVPGSRRPIIVPSGSPMRWRVGRGLVG